VCEWYVCAWCARGRESRKTVQAAATMGRVHPARISFYPIPRGSAAGCTTELFNIGIYIALYNIHNTI